ncbi:ribosomal protection-like ABC-F family protein [Fusibacter ferrireducens]|uniref:ABC-F family ATP-binding cassette domain-containing protein n=1 Tax=Fusibacter ferrireducens TaxID=2785058 RepID=A0ABR9ZQH8_9FIRM|nr:ABC-F family ATP-binding cassette domain-containing protein [Fusibacter ferrireducens]MBF4692712.1 ABC-F family ATP-binding cassette domain-containing protein [Fusibacter ferrireducens]
MGLLTLQNISKEYQNKVVLEGASLMVEKGECVSLVGPNGSGKSTLLKIAMGLEMPDSGQHYFSSGIKVGYLSQNVDEQETGKNALHHEALFQLENQLNAIFKKLENDEISQDQKAYEACMRRYEKLYEKFEAMDGYNIQSKIKRILLGLGLREGALELPVERLSGGEKMRVALARILLDEPDLLILDEPTNHLDIKAIEWLEEYIKRFSGGVLIVSHDRYFLDRVTTRIAELSHGHLSIKKCNYTSYIEQKTKISGFYLKENSNLKKQIRDGEEKVQKLRKYKKIKQSKSTEKAVEKLKIKSQKLMMEMKKSENLMQKSKPKLSFKPATHMSKDIVLVEHLTKRFSDYTVLKEISFEIHGGERIGLIGPNGCGKTTLLNVILGKDIDFTGHVNFGKWVDYAYLGQEITFEDENRSVLETFEVEFPKLERKEIKKHLALFNFYGDEVDKRIEVLSGGEKTRVALARIMLNQPHCLILDEPTNHLDLESREAIENAILSFRGTVIAVSHDRFYLNQCVTRILELRDGKILSFDGNYDQYCRANVVEQNSNATKSIEERVKSDGFKANKFQEIQHSKRSEQHENEQRENEQIEEAILALEAQIANLDQTETDANDLEFYQKYGDLVADLEVLYQRYYEQNA